MKAFNQSDGTLVEKEDRRRHFHPHPPHLRPQLLLLRPVFRPRHCLPQLWLPDGQLFHWRVAASCHA
jgi:hypothetical protein